MIVRSDDIDLQRSRVTECFTKFTLHLVFGRKVKLLKKLGRNGDASGGPDVLQGQVLIHAIVEVLMIVSAAIPIS